MTAAHAGEALQELPEVSVVIGQFEIPQPATAGAFRAAKARGASTVLNPAPAAPLTPELLAATDWLIPNEGEFSTLAGSEVVTDEAARRFSAEHDIRLLITLGADGVALLALNGQLDRIPAPSVEATDTTGAGDAFVGAFSFGLASGLSDASAARLGILCAADSVIRSGAQSSFPDRDRCRQLLAEASA